MVLQCKKCNSTPVFRVKKNYCANIGCIDYNKIVRRSYAKKEETCEEE